MSRNIAESLLSKDQFEPAYEGNLIQTCEQLSRSDPGDSETALVRAQLPAIDGDAMADVFAARWAGADRRNLCSVDAIIQCKCGSDDSCLVLAEFKNRRVGTVERKTHPASSGKPRVDSKFVFDNEGGYDGTKEDFGLSIRRKILETMLMLLLEDVSGIRTNPGKRRAMIVVDAKANGIRESDRARGSFEVLKEYKGIVFDSIRVVTAKTFDEWAEHNTPTFSSADSSQAVHM